MLGYICNTRITRHLEGRRSDGRLTKLSSVDFHTSDFEGRWANSLSSQWNIPRLRLKIHGYWTTEEETEWACLRWQAALTGPQYFDAQQLKNQTYSHSYA